MIYFKFKNISWIILACLFCSMGSCGDLEELNENPNQPQSTTLSSILPSIIKQTANLTVEESFLFSNNAAQLTAKSLRSEVDAYNWQGFDIWNPIYNILRDVNVLEQQAIFEENKSYEAVAIIWRCYLFSMLTDMYGDIPYTEALKGKSEANFRPKYDTQEEVYTGEKGLLKELGRANDILNGNRPNIDGDILFDNNLIKWQRFCNSLRLRLLVRVSKQKNVITELTSLLTNTSQLMQSNDDNAVLQYQGAGANSNPITQLKSGDFDAVRISENLVRTFKMMSDPRLGVYARQTDATINDLNNVMYLGWENGVGCDTDGSRLGLMYYDYPNHPTSARSGDAIFMTYSEVNFLQAEIVQRGLVATGASVEILYNEGIKAALEYYDVDERDFGWNSRTDFINSTNVKYDQNLNTIWKQKWIALYFSGFEGYIEVRRWLDYYNGDWTQLPFLSPPCNNQNADQLPTRFIYPVSEGTLNSDQFNIATSRMGGNTENTKIWLIQ